MPLFDSAIIANGIQNFLIPENNTNGFANDLISNSAIISDEGVVSGFQILQTPSPSSQIRIQFSASVASKNGKIGVACLKTPDNEFLPITIRSATALLLDIPENTSVTTRFDLICLYADFRTVGANNFRLRLFTNSSLSDPDLDAWMIANPNQILMPIGRIAKTPGSLVNSSQIVMNGNTTYNPASSVRAVAKYNAGTVKIMTEVERNASSWQPGDLVIVKAPLDINNALWVNMSTTPTAFWKQVVLVAQAVSQWILLNAQNLPFSSGTFNLPENQGTPSGGFTLPANFWAVGIVLTISDTISFVPLHQLISTTSGAVHTTTKNFSINGTLLSAGSIARTFFGSSGGQSFLLEARTLSSVVTITCRQIIGNNAQLEIITENWAGTGGSFTTPRVYNKTTNTQLITILNNVALVMTESIVINNPAQPGGMTSHQLTQFEIKKQQ